MVRSTGSIRFIVSFISVLIGLTALASSAEAQAAGAGGSPSMFIQLVPFAVMFGVMYFLMIRPQMRKQKEHQSFLMSLARGTEVITSSGILGRIEGITDSTVTLEIAPSVRIKVLRTAITGSAKAAVAGPTEVKA